MIYCSNKTARFAYNFFTIWHMIQNNCSAPAMTLVAILTPCLITAFAPMKFLLQNLYYLLIQHQVLYEHCHQLYIHIQ